VHRPTGTQPTPTNQHPHFPCIGNEHLTSDKETNPNKRPFYHLTKKRPHVFPLTHNVTIIPYAEETTCLPSDTYPLTHSAEQQSYVM